MRGSRQLRFKGFLRSAERQMLSLPRLRVPARGPIYMCYGKAVLVGGLVGDDQGAQ
jgi:hypothetical protein